MEKEGGSNDRREIQHQRIVALDVRQFMQCERVQLCIRKFFGEPMWERNQRMERAIGQRRMKMVDLDDHAAAFEAYLLARSFEDACEAWIGDDSTLAGISTQTQSTQADQPQQERQATLARDMPPGYTVESGSTSQTWRTDMPDACSSAVVVEATWVSGTAVANTSEPSTIMVVMARTPKDS